MNRLIIISILIAVCAAQLGACTSDPRDRPIRIQLGAEPVSLDPAIAEDGAALRILANTMDGLVGYDGKSALKKKLAESFSISQDGRRMEFSLRKNARWSDGKIVSADDFVVGFRRALSPESVSKLGSMLNPIKNAVAFHKGAVPAQELGVRVEQAKLIIELERPAPYFLHALTLPAALPSRVDVLKKNNGNWPETAPVTGPYKITAHTHDQRILLEKNPHYYDGNEGEPSIELLIVSDESTALHLFEQGKLDIANKLPLTEFKRLKIAGSLRTFPFLATYYLGFNTSKPPFQDVKWRRAVAAALNKNELLAALDSSELPAYSWIPPGLEGFSAGAAETPHRDSGLKGKFRNTVRAGFDSSSRNSLVFEKVQRDLLEKLGLKIALQNMDWKTYVKTLQSDAPALFRFGWQAPFLDPLPHLLAFTSKNPNNYTHWRNSRYDELVEKIRALPTGAERADLVRQADSLLVNEEAVVIPIYHYMQNFAVAPQITRFQMNVFGVVPFNELVRSK